jgi:maltooligosyltrehalose synthase
MRQWVARRSNKLQTLWGMNPEEAYELALVDWFEYGYETSE